MSMSRLFAVAAATALMSGAALAQITTTTTTTAPVDQVPVNPAAPPAMMTDPSMMMSDPSMMSPNPATTPSASAMGTDTAGVIPMSSQSPEVQATLKAGDPNVVSNQPVADTPENRAKYGKPMSNAGKRSAANGN